MLYVRGQEDGKWRNYTIMYYNVRINIKAIVLFDAFHTSTSKILANSLKIMYPLFDSIERLGVQGGVIKLYGFQQPQGKDE